MGATGSREVCNSCGDPARTTKYAVLRPSHHTVAPRLGSPLSLSPHAAHTSGAGRPVHDAHPQTNNSLRYGKGAAPANARPPHAPHLGRLASPPALCSPLPTMTRSTRRLASSAAPVSGPLVAGGPAAADAAAVLPRPSSAAPWPLPGCCDW